MTFSPILLRKFCLYRIYYRIIPANECMPTRIGVGKGERHEDENSPGLRSFRVDPACPIRSNNERHSHLRPEFRRRVDCSSHQHVRKNITTLDLGVTTTYKDGTTGDSEIRFDWNDEDAFAPGMVIDKPFGGFGNAETVKVVVDIVVYSDLAAEVTNDRAFQSIIRQRKEGILTMQKVNEIIGKAATPEAAAAELERVASTVPTSRTDESLRVTPTILCTAANQIRQGRDPNEIVKQNNTDIAKHDSEITKIN